MQDLILEQFRNAADKGDLNFFIGEFNEDRTIKKEWINEALLRSAQSVLCTSEIVNLLFEKGANVNYLDSVGRNALHHAVYGGTRNIEKAKILLDKGINIDARCTESMEGITPLYHAVDLHCSGYSNPNNDKKPFIKFLLENGANPNIAGKYSNSFKTPSELANHLGFDGLANFITSTTTNIRKATLKTIEDLEAENRRLKSDVMRHRSLFFRQPKFEVSAAILTIFFAIGVGLVINDGVDIQDKKGKLSGQIIMAACIVILIAYLARQFRIAQSEIVSMLDGAKKEGLLISRNIQGTLSDIGSAAKAIKQATKTANDAIKDLSASTDNFIVLLKDELKNTLVELRGNAKDVADAIQTGIDANKFKPDAKVDIKVDVHDNVKGNTVCNIM